MSSSELSEQAVFESEIATSMSKAFELACRSFRGGGHPDLVKEIIAKRIIIIARQGVADPSILCEAALESLGRQGDPEDDGRLQS